MMKLILFCLVSCAFVKTWANYPDNPWEDDGIHSCGPKYPLPNGRASECDPQSRYPCCDPNSGWCGMAPRQCNCTGCIDYRKSECTFEGKSCGEHGCNDAVCRTACFADEMICKVGKCDGRNCKCCELKTGCTSQGNFCGQHGSYGVCRASCLANERICKVSKCDGQNCKCCKPTVCRPKCFNGECMGHNVCKCKQGWTGRFCQTGPAVVGCEDKRYNCANLKHNCEKKGWKNWMKIQCQKTCGLCNKDKCSPKCLNGECMGHNVCKCKQGWAENLCQTAECSPKCLNGDCTSPNICKCTQGWTGNLCQTSVCSPKCLNGKCAGPNICKCKQGWTGNICQTPVCSPKCLNGKCAGPNICKCKQGWAGNLCQTPVCHPKCLNGECTGPNICKCKKEWTGNLCQTRPAVVGCEDKRYNCANLKHNCEKKGWKNWMKIQCQNTCGLCNKEQNCHDVCPEIYEPVCGTDGQSYINSCYLILASCLNPALDIVLQYEGECHNIGY